MNIDLTDEQIRRSKICDKYWNKIDFLIKKGVLDIICGKATINFDKAGNISCIEKHLFEYPHQDS
jgi:hypothetical protein